MQTLIEMLTNDTSVSMQYEIAIMLCAFFVSSLCIKGRKMLTAVWLGIFLFFIYIHRVLLPFIISGAYLLLLSGIVRAVIRMDPGELAAPARILAKKLKEYTVGPLQPFTAVILTVLLIQLCRLNISIDYDSIRYGLRSDVLLTNGEGLRGFFSNTGLVNSVYSYPKGFEILTRPLYFGGTLGNVLCVNVWMLIGVILLTGETAYILTGASGAGVFAAMMAALMPGITNMSVTAKSDLATLFCQLCFVYCAVRYFREDGGKDAGLLAGAGTAALIMSYSFKTTAVVFSSVMGLAAAVYFARKRRLPLPDKSGVRAIVAAMLCTGLITARTFVVTGQPFSGVFTEMFEAMGMKLKYPFRSQGFIYSDEAAGLADRIAAFLRRLAGFLVCPAGEDMSHVIMAWGGIAFLILTIVMLCFSHLTAERMEKLGRLAKVGGAAGIGSAPEAFRFIRQLWIIEGAVSLVSLYMLYQVDGNYFMLMYALTAAAGSAVYFTGAEYEESGLKNGGPHFFSGGNSAALILLSAVMIYITAFTGWCGPVGFTKADPLNRGCYDHESLFLKDYGIWDKNDRVLAFAGEPECYRVRGRIESWVDIDGSGGNVYLTDTKLNIFKEYLEFADIDYIYADLDYIYDQGNPRRIRAGVLFEYLLEDGCFEELSLIEAPGAGREVAARLDKARVAVDWEVPVSDGTADRTAGQTEYFAEICSEYADGRDTDR